MTGEPALGPFASTPSWLKLTLLTRFVHSTGVMSHTSPTPSPSVSSWSALGVATQLSAESGKPSPSASGASGTVVTIAAKVCRVEFSVGSTTFSASVEYEIVVPSRLMLGESEREPSASG